jgi:hypothetical protein
MIRRFTIALVSAALLLLAASIGLAEMSKGQTQYVPCSSHIFHGPKSRQLDLTVTLVVRNIDTKRPLSLTSVDYYGSDGQLVRRYLAAPVAVQPLSAREFVVDEKDMAGAALNAPIVEAVMIGSSNGLGISYINRGVAIQE